MKKNIEGNINRKFEERYKLLFEDNYQYFLEWSLKPLKKSIRINTIKVKDKTDGLYNINITVRDLIDRLKEKGWELRKIPFYEYGYWIENFVDVGKTEEFILGYYHTQEAASMIPPIVLDPKENDVILDMAAAPGSKTSQIAMHMNNNGLIIANDVDSIRIAALADNLQRLGVINTIITKMDGREIDKLGIKFDKVLLDAPCSATGAIRKSISALTKWSENVIRRLSKLQKQLILKAFDVLKERGILVYSTCSIDVEENEEVVDYLLKNRENAKIERINIENLKHSEPILEWNGKEYDPDIKYTLRIYPWDNDTEGFYIAKIKKIYEDT